jgi:hypothetical protein
MWTNKTVKMNKNDGRIPIKDNEKEYIADQKKFIKEYKMKTINEQIEELLEKYQVTGTAVYDMDKNETIAEYFVGDCIKELSTLIQKEREEAVQKFSAHLLSVITMPDYEEPFKNMVWHGLETYLSQTKGGKGE